MTPTTRRRLEALERHAEASTVGLHLIIRRSDASMAEMEKQTREAASAEAAGRQVLTVRVVASDRGGRPAPGQKLH